MRIYMPSNRLHFLRHRWFRLVTAALMTSGLAITTACLSVYKHDEVTTSKPVLASCCADPESSCCVDSERAMPSSWSLDRRDVDEFMLMMQGMAGIQPDDSRWVASKLFDGFVPAPMPCCGPSGSKSPSEEHSCCKHQ